GDRTERMRGCAGTSGRGRACDGCTATAACRSTTTATRAELLLGGRALALGWCGLRVGAGSLGRAAAYRSIRACTLVRRRRCLGFPSGRLASERACAGCRGRCAACASAAARRTRAATTGPDVLLDRGPLALGAW